jgi:hypothetical protein
VAKEKRSQRAFILNEVKRLIHIGVTLLQGPLAHLLDKLLSVAIIKDGSVGDSLKAWSFVEWDYREMVVRVLFLLLFVCF